MSNKTGLWIIGLLIAHALFAHAFESYYSKAPLSERIELGSTFDKEFDITVPMSQTYQVELRFAREGRDFEYLKSILGNMTNQKENGVPLKVSWKLQSDDKVFAQNELVAIDSCGWSKEHVYRCLGSFKVPPGKYRFHIYAPNPDGVFDQFKTSLSINYNFKNAHTWQTAYMFWAMLFNIVVAPALGCIILLATAIKTLNKSSKRDDETGAPS